MAGSTPIYGFPYPESSDLVANYPALGEQLAEDIENVLSAGFGKVLQIVNTQYATSVNSSSSSYVSTGLTATITPSNTTNNILVVATCTLSSSSADAVISTLFRGTISGTNLAPTGGTQYFYKGYAGGNNTQAYTIVYLDSPATTSATQYTIGFRVESGAATYTAQQYSIPSTMTLLEVKA